MVSVDSGRDGVLAVTGDIDLLTAPAVRDAVLAAAAAAPGRGICLDLSGVTFLDCAGVRMLLGAGHCAAQRGCELRLANPRGIVRRVLEAFDVPAASTVTA